jgi:spore germination protein GerM
MRRLRVALIVGVAALALSSCTLVSPNTGPKAITSKVPFGLLNQTIPGTNHARVRFVAQAVYFVDATGHLTPSSRIVYSPAALENVIAQLLLGPSAIESSAGYTSALPRKLVLVSADVKNQVGTINFATPLSTLSRMTQLLAVGQLVFTAYDVGAPKGIVIKVAGVTQDLLLPSGQRASLVTETDFLSLLNG